jgi:hypothetical protein
VIGLWLKIRRRLSLGLLLMRVLMVCLLPPPYPVVLSSSSKPHVLYEYGFFSPCANFSRGRTLAIVPRCTKKSGYVDMDRDDYPAGSEQENWQEICLSMTHRTLPKEHQ